MDSNGRTSTEPDWPPGEPDCLPGHSQDSSANQHGRQLLQCCRASDARICNGRVPGSTSGHITSFGSKGSGRSVVDYFVTSASLLPLLPWMAVNAAHPAAQLSDHATLLLELACPATAQPQRGLDEQPPAQQQQEQPPPRRHFCRASEEQLETAVGLLDAAATQLTALAAEADAAASSAHLA